MATVYQNQGAYDAALEELEKALSLAETNNFGFLKAEIYSILGQVYENKGAYQKALESLNVALELNRKIGNRYGEGQNLGSIGLVHKNQRQPEQALLIFKQAIEIAQQIGNKRLEGTQIGNLGTVYQMLRRYDESVVHYKEAIDIAKEIGDRKEEGRNVGNLGIVYGAMREYDTAIEHYRESIKIAQEIGDRKREGIQIGDLGRLFFQLGRFDEAIANCKRALGIAEEIGVMNTAKTLLRLLTLIYQNIGHYDVAIHYCKRALLVIKELQLTSFESFQMGTLGFLYSEVGAYEKAVSSYGSSIKIARESGNKEGEGLNLGNLGDTLLKTGRYDESKEALIGAIDIFKAVKYDHAVGVFQGSLALLLASQGRFEEATELLDSSEAHVKVDANEHGKFLCKKARVLLLMEDHDGARQVLAEAENIAQANNASQISELGRLITGIRDELNPEMGMKSLSEEQIEDVKIEADEIFEMGKIEASQSNHELALRSYRQSVILFKKIQDPVGTLSVKLKMVKTDRERGAFKEALTQAVGMLHVVEKHNLKHMKSKVYLEMALGYLELGQREEAIVACEAALKENRNVEDLRLESQTLSLMGDVFCLMSNHGEALGCYEQSNHLAEKVGNTGQTIRNLNGLATAHASLGNTESAILHYKDAVEKSRLSKNFSEAAFTLGALGETLMEQERWKEARACLEEAIELCGETEHRHVFGTFRGLLALWYALQADFSSATNLIANCENHFGSSSSSGDIEAQVIFLCNKSKVCHLQGKSEEARNMLQMARDLSASINPRPKIILDGRIAKTMVFLNGGTE
jgi:tetratricopeptide (TPR) repeat protein